MAFLHVDTLYTGQVESEFNAWSGKGAEETPGSTVDVNGDIKARLLFKFIENLGDFFDGFVVAGIGGAKDDKDS
jgi:hypothetical protein